jgi:uncharacterized repeat protein (TIGR03803 family)
MQRVGFGAANISAQILRVDKDDSSCKKTAKPPGMRVLPAIRCYSFKPLLSLGEPRRQIEPGGWEMGSKQFGYFVSKALAAAAVAMILVSGAWATNTEKVLFTFTGGNDGGDPAAQLTFDSSGNAYGTTVVGGTANLGTVFKLTPHANGKSTETVLYSFSGGSDGKAPHGGVTLDSKGNLYGTAVAGGSGGTCTGDGCGTVYKLTHSGGSWNFRVIYNFRGGTDGFGPGGGVVFDKNGNLYGTTPDGGSANGCNGIGCGVVYKLSPAKNGQWTEKVIHRFTGGNDGRRDRLVCCLSTKPAICMALPNRAVLMVPGRHSSCHQFREASGNSVRWMVSRARLTPASLMAA